MDSIGVRPVKQDVIALAAEAIATLRTVVDDLEAPDHFVGAVEDLEERFGEFYEDLISSIAA